MYTNNAKVKIKNKILKKIDEASKKFSGNINEHLKFGPVEAYMIIGKYHRLGVENKKLCLVVSSIGIGNEKCQGKGFFKDYIQILSDIAKDKDYRLVFESVNNPKLTESLRKHDYNEVEYTNNFYKDFI